MNGLTRSNKLAYFFGKLYLFWCGWQAGLCFLVLIGLLTRNNQARHKFFSSYFST